MKTLLWLSLCLSLTACQKKFEPLYQKAEAAFESKNHVECIDAVTLALPLWKEDDGNEKKARAYELLGKSYHSLLKTEKAAEAYEQAINLSDKTFDSAYSLGLIRLTSGQPRLASEAFLKALKMKRDDPQALLGLGNSFYALKKHQEARQIYQRIINTSPAVKEALEHLRILDLRSRPAKKAKKPVIKKNSKGKKPSLKIRY